MRRTGVGALILAGGASARMGSDKALLDWGGVRAIDRVARTVVALGADPVITVGVADYGYPHLVEDPPGGGPAAGVLAGARRLAALGMPRVLVLAADAPLVRPGDLAPLLMAPAPGATFAGLHLPLAFDLAALPEADGQGWSMGRLVQALALLRIDPPRGAELRLRGANTPEERARLLVLLDVRPN